MHIMRRIIAFLALLSLTSSTIRNVWWFGIWFGGDDEKTFEIPRGFHGENEGMPFVLLMIAAISAVAPAWWLLVRGVGRLLRGDN